jgi:hypothetical protein
MHCNPRYNRTHLAALVATIVLFSTACDAGSHPISVGSKPSQPESTSPPTAPPTTQFTHEVPPGSRFLGSYSTATPSYDQPESHVTLSTPQQGQSPVISWEAAAEVCGICYVGNPVDVYLADASSTTMAVMNGVANLHGQLVYVISQYPGYRCGSGGAPTLADPSTTTLPPAPCHDIDFVDAKTGSLLTSESFGP